MSDVAKPIDVDLLLQRYETFFLDAYGVLVQGGGLIPGALEFVQRLHFEDKEFFILSNDASRTTVNATKKYQKLGFPIEYEQVITSGSLLTPYFEQNDLKGAKTLVLGTSDAKELVRQAGGETLAFKDPTVPDVIAICDDRGYELASGINRVLTVIGQATTPDQVPTLLLPNNDLVYTTHKNEFAFTAGSLGAMVEAFLKQKFNAEAPELVRLGKPHKAIFNEALKRAKGRQPLMIGDQLHTDILGAQKIGMDSCLSLMGVTKDLNPSSEIQPDYVLTTW